MPCDPRGRCRINQLDSNVTRMFKANRISIQPKFDLFNALKVSRVYSVRNSLGSATTLGFLLYGTPSSCSRSRS